MGRHVNHSDFVLCFGFSPPQTLRLARRRGHGIGWPSRDGRGAHSPVHASHEVARDTVRVLQRDLVLLTPPDLGRAGAWSRRSVVVAVGSLTSASTRPCARHGRIQGYGEQQLLLVRGGRLRDEARRRKMGAGRIGRSAYLPPPTVLAHGKGRGSWPSPSLATFVRRSFTPCLSPEKDHLESRGGKNSFRRGAEGRSWRRWQLECHIPHKWETDLDVISKSSVWSSLAVEDGRADFQILHRGLPRNHVGAPTDFLDAELEKGIEKHVSRVGSR